MASSACMSHSPLCTRPMRWFVGDVVQRSALHLRNVSIATGGRGISNPSATRGGYD